MHGVSFARGVTSVRDFFTASLLHGCHFCTERHFFMGDTLNNRMKYPIHMTPCIGDTYYDVGPKDPDEQGSSKNQNNCYGTLNFIDRRVSLLIKMDSLTRS